MQKQQARTIKPAADKPSEVVTQYCISLYKEPPSGEVCIEEFERFAIDRLRGVCISMLACGTALVAKYTPYIARCAMGSAFNSLLKPVNIDDNAIDEVVIYI